MKPIVPQLNAPLGLQRLLACKWRSRLYVSIWYLL